MDSFWSDVRQALRMFRANPGLTAIAVLSLAIGIGPNSAIFSLIDGLGLRPLPIRDASRLVVVSSATSTRRDDKSTFAEYVAIRDGTRSFAELAASAPQAAGISGGQEGPAVVFGSLVSANYFSTLGVDPILGRTFLAEEDRTGPHPVVIVGERIWAHRFNRDPQILGRTVRLNQLDCTIVGVMPARFAGTTPVLASETWMPIMLAPALLPGDGARMLRADGRRTMSIYGRLRPGTTLEQARAEMAEIGRRIERDLPQTHRGWGINTRPLQEEFVGPQARLVFALLAGAAAAVLFVGCANIANLLLARGVGRSRELAVRAALGASRLRLVRQMMVESLVLAAAGAAGGLVAAQWGLALLRASFVTDRLVLERAVVNGGVLAFVAVVAVGATAFFGLVPALQAAARDVTGTLRDASRATGAPRTRRLASLLVAGEVAVAVVFLAVAILFMRTLAALERVEPGFDPRNLLTLRVALPEDRYEHDASIVSFYERVIERLRTLPDVTAAGATFRVPAAGSRFNPNRSLVIEGRPLPAGETRFAADLTVTPGYLEAIGLPLRAGRPLAARDGRNAPLVVVVSDTVVRRYWSNAPEQALGAGIRLGDEPSPDAWRTIVGVVGDVRNDDIDAPPLPQVYVPLAQRPARDMTFVLRTADDPLAHVRDARAAVAAIDADQPVYDVKTMAQVFEEDGRQSVLLGEILALFAFVALVLAGVGIYGVVAHSVAQRTREIGVRLALGATDGNLRRLVVRQAFLPLAAGLAVGLAGSAALSQLLQSLLYGVTPTDPVTYCSVVLVFCGVALAACIIPVRRATKVGPVTALRAE